jgi:hypothetical protein
VVSIAVYLAAMGVALDRRNRRTWESLAARLAPGSGRRVPFRNAGVLLEMVDYACRADNHFDASLAETLRSEAIRVRLGTVLSPTHWV